MKSIVDNNAKFPYKSVGERLLAIRKHLNLTQEQFGEMLKGDGEAIDKSTISKYELGKDEVSNKIKVELYSTIKVSKEWFEKGEGEMFITANTNNNPHKQVQKAATTETIKQSSDVNYGLNLQPPINQGDRTMENRYIGLLEKKDEQMDRLLNVIEQLMPSGKGKERTTRKREPVAKRKVS